MAGTTRAPTGRARRSGGGVDLDRLAALEEERDFLLTSLRDLEAEHDAGDLDETDYVELKDDYTARAAAVLRAIESDHAELAAAPRRSPARTAAWVVGVLLVGVLAGLLVAQASGRRGSDDGITGDIRQSSRDLLLQAQDQWAGGDVEGALATYDDVLELSPADPEALAYKAWVGRNGELLGDEEVLDLLDEAVAADPTYPDARIFRAIVLRDAGRSEEAAADLVALDPAGVPPAMAAMVGGFGVGLADARLSQGDVAGANELLDVVLAIDPENVEALLARGILLGRAAASPSVSAEDRDLLADRALSSLDQASDLAPDEPAVPLARATVLVGLGRDDEALVALAAFDALDPSDDLVARADELRASLGS